MTWRKKASFDRIDAQLTAFLFDGRGIFRPSEIGYPMDSRSDNPPAAAEGDDDEANSSALNLADA